MEGCSGVGAPTLLFPIKGLLFGAPTTFLSPLPLLLLPVLLICVGSIGLHGTSYFLKYKIVVSPLEKTKPEEPIVLVKFSLVQILHTARNARTPLVRTLLYAHSMFPLSYYSMIQYRYMYCKTRIGGATRYLRVQLNKNKYINPKS